MTDVEKKRAIERLKNVRMQLSKAKRDVGFWTHELSLVVEELSADKQFNFDEIFNKEIENV